MGTNQTSYLTAFSRGCWTGGLVPSSKITKLLDTPCNTPSCWKVSGKAFLMQKEKPPRLDACWEMQQTSWATGKKVALFRKIRHENTCSTCFVCMYTHCGSEVIFEKPFWLPSSFHMERCSWCKVLCFTNLWLRNSAHSFSLAIYPTIQYVFLASFQCLDDHFSNHHQQYRMTSKLLRYLK